MELLKKYGIHLAVTKGEVVSSGVDLEYAL